MKRLVPTLLALLVAFYVHGQEVVTEQFPTGLKVGEEAPVFTAKDHSGETVELNALLQKG